jgi:hypothetical protein
MDKKKYWINWFISMLKEFLSELTKKSKYEILNIYECQKTNFIKAEIKLSGRHIIEKNISEIVTDLALLEGFDKKTIRTLTYMATVERLKPDYSIVVQQLGVEVDDYILEIRSKNGTEISKKTPFEMSKDKILLSKFSPIDANRIGYLAGIKETVEEFKMKSTKIEKIG